MVRFMLYHALMKLRHRWMGKCDVLGILRMVRFKLFFHNLPTVEVFHFSSAVLSFTLFKNKAIKIRGHHMNSLSIINFKITHLQGWNSRQFTAHLCPCDLRGESCIISYILICNTWKLNIMHLILEKGVSQIIDNDIIIIHFYLKIEYIKIMNTQLMFYSNITHDESSSMGYPAFICVFTYFWNISIQ